MTHLNDLKIGNAPEEINVLIEIPKGSQNKYELDKDSGLITLDRVFYTAFAYPMDYGMVPETHWHDGDPLDALVINTAEPYYPGVVIPCRPIAVVRMIDDGEKDEKLICVPLKDPRLDEMQDKDDIAPHVLKELTHFFEHYKDLQDKKVVIEGIDGKAEAIKAIEEGIQLYKEQSK